MHSILIRKAEVKSMNIKERKIIERAVLKLQGYKSFDDNNAKKIMGLKETADYVGVTKSGINNFRSRDKEGFPIPYIQLSSGPIWLTKDINEYCIKKNFKKVNETEKKVLKIALLGQNGRGAKDTALRFIQNRNFYVSSILRTNIYCDLNIILTDKFDSDSYIEFLILYGEEEMYSNIEIFNGLSVNLSRQETVKKFLKKINDELKIIRENGTEINCMFNIYTSPKKIYKNMIRNGDIDVIEVKNIYIGNNLYQNIPKADMYFYFVNDEDTQNMSGISENIDKIKYIIGNKPFGIIYYSDYIFIDDDGNTDKEAYEMYKEDSIKLITEMYMKKKFNDLDKNMMLANILKKGTLCDDKDDENNKYIFYYSSHLPDLKFYESITSAIYANDNKYSFDNGIIKVYKDNKVEFTDFTKKLFDKVFSSKLFANSGKENKNITFITREIGEKSNYEYEKYLKTLLKHVKTAENEVLKGIYTIFSSYNVNEKWKKNLLLEFYNSLYDSISDRKISEDIEAIRISQDIYIRLSNFKYDGKIIKTNDKIENEIRQYTDKFKINPKMKKDERNVITTLFLIPDEDKEERFVVIENSYINNNYNDFYEGIKNVYFANIAVKAMLNTLTGIIYLAEKQE